jgi:hypothetical protein
MKMKSKDKKQFTSRDRTIAVHGGSGPKLETRKFQEPLQRDRIDDRQSQRVGGRVPGSVSTRQFEHADPAKDMQKQGRLAKNTKPEGPK